MPTTVQNIIEAAYSRSTANDPGKLATDGELLSVLNRVFQWLYALSAAAAPDAHAAKSALAALAGAPPSAVLPVDIIDIRRVENNAGAKVNVIPLEERDRGWHLAPAVYRIGNSIVSRGAAAGTFGAAADPVAGDILTLYHLDAPVLFAALTDTLDARFPVRYHELLVLVLAMYLATKDSGRSPQEFAALEKAYQLTLEAFFRLSGLSTTALQSPHGGVIVQRLNELIASARAAQPQG